VLRLQKTAVNLIEPIDNLGPTERLGVLPGARGGLEASRPIVDEADNFLCKVAFVPIDESRAAVAGYNLPKTAVVARHHGLAAGRVLDCGMPDITNSWVGTTKRSPRLGMLAKRSSALGPG